MTVAVDTTRLEYRGTGSTVAFTFPWRLLAPSDITVFVDHGQRFDFTVTGGTTDAGGFITLGSPPALDSFVWLIRQIPQTQPYDLHEFDTMSAESQELSFDRITLLLQDLQSQVDRCIQFRHTAHLTGPPAISNVFPLPGHGQFIKWNLEGTQLEVGGVPSGGGDGGGDLTGEGAPGQIAFWTAPKVLRGDGKLLWNNDTKQMTVGTTPLGPLKAGNAFMGLVGPMNNVGMQNLMLQTVQGDPSLIGLVTLGDDRVGISSWNFRGAGAANPIYGANFGVVFSTNGVANGLEIDVQNDSATDYQGQALWLNGSTRSTSSAGHRANAILIDTQDVSKWERGILFKEGFVANGATGSIEKMGIHFEHSQDADFIVIQPRLGTAGNIAVKLTNPEFTVNRFEILNSGAIRVGDTMTGPAFPSYAFVEDQTTGMYMEGPSILGFSVSGIVPGSSPPITAGIKRMTLGDALNLFPVTQTPNNTGTINFWDQFSVHSVGLMANDFIGNSFRIKLPQVPGGAGQCLVTSGPVGSLGSEIETWSYAPCGAGGGGGGTGTVTSTGVLDFNALVVGNGGVDIRSLGTLGAGNLVLHGNAGGAPTFSAVNLAADVTGRLSLANLSLAPGGPGVLLGRRQGGGAGDWEEITLGANLTMTGTTLAAGGAGAGAPTTATYWTSTADAALSAEVNMGALSNGLVRNTVSAGVGTPSTYGGTQCLGQFIRALDANGVATCATVALAGDVSGDLPYSSLAPGAPLSVLGVAGNAPADVASIVAGTDGSVLQRTGTTLGFAALNLASSAAVTNRLPYPNLPSASGGSVLVGRGPAGSGDMQELTLGPNLSISGTVLNAGGLGDVVGPAPAIDSEVALFSGPTGKLLKRASGTGPARLTAGVLGTGLTNLASEVTGDLPLAGVVPASAASLVLGRGGAAGPGDWQELTLGPGLALSGTTLTTAVGVGDVTGPAASIDGEVALFSLATGKLLKRATGTGPARLTAGVLVTGVTNLASEVSGDLPLSNVAPATGPSLLLGRGNLAGGGDWQEITIGTNLALSGTVLNASGGGGAPLTATYITQTPDATLTNEQALSLLTSGYMLSAFGTGVVTTQTATQLTASLDLFTSALKGLVPLSGGGTVNFLRADGNWAAPGGGGNVTTGTLTSNTLPKASGATAIINSLLTDNATLLTYAGSTGTTALKGAFTNNASMLVFGTANTTTVTMASLSADRIFTLPDAASNPVRPLTCGAGQFVSAIASTGILTCTTPVAGSGTVTHTAGALTLNQLVLGNAVDDVKPLGALGTAVTVLHGNVAGPPTWGAVALATDVTGLLPTASLPAHTGDVTSAAGSAVLTIAADVVTFAKLQNIATGRFVGRSTAAAGDPEELTGTQATTLLDVYTSALKGLAPASGGGTTNFLRADGAWANPAGGNVSAAGVLALNELVIGQGTAVVATLGTLGAGNLVLHGNAGGAPTWGAVALTTDVAGRLPYANLTAPTAASRLLGRGDALGDWQELTLGANLTLTGTTLSASAGTGAPLTSPYWTSTSDAALLNEVSMGALTTGLVLNTVAAGTGTPTAYGGTFCTNQFVRALNASGLATCGSIVNADLANSSITVTGTPNRVLVTGSPVALGGTVTLTGPQDMHTGAAPTFSTLALTANANELVLGTSNTTTVTMATLTAPRTFILPDANSNPVRPLACGAGSFVNEIASSGILTCAPAGGGTVTTSGSPVANHLAFFTNPTEITGAPALQYNPTTQSLSVTRTGGAWGWPLPTNDPRPAAVQVLIGSAATPTTSPNSGVYAAVEGAANGNWLAAVRGDAVARGTATLANTGIMGGLFQGVNYGTATSGDLGLIALAGRALAGVTGSSNWGMWAISQDMGLSATTVGLEVNTELQFASRTFAQARGLIVANHPFGTSAANDVGIQVTGYGVAQWIPDGQVQIGDATAALASTPLTVAAPLGNLVPVVRLENNLATTTAPRTALALVRNTAAAQMGDGFGVRQDFILRDQDAVDNINARFIVERNAADGTAVFRLQTAIAGALGDRLTINNLGQLFYTPTPTTGTVGLIATATQKTELQFYTDNNANTVAFTAPATSAGNWVWRLPQNFGASGSVLANDGAGNLSWATGAGNVATTGTPLANQMTFFTGGSTISGSPSFAFNSGTGVLTLLGPGSLHVGITPFGGQAAGPIQSTVSNSDNALPYQALLGQIVNGSSAGVGAATVANDKVAVSGWAHRGAGGSSPIYGGNFTAQFNTTGVAVGLELGVINNSGSNNIGNGLWVNGIGSNSRDNAILIDTQDASKWNAGIRFVEGNVGGGASGTIAQFGIIFDKSHDADFIVIRPRLGAGNNAIRITDSAFAVNKFAVTNTGVVTASGDISTTANMGAVQYFASGLPGFSGTKTLGTCVMTVTGGIITGFTGGPTC